MTDSNEPEKSEEPAPDSEQLELTLPGEASNLKDLGLWAGVLALLTLIAFWPATTGTFLWRDDVMAANSRLLAPAGLSQSWLGRWTNPTEFNRPVYQPVTDTAYWLEYRLGGRSESGPPAPVAFHIAGLVFQVGAAVLLWLILRELLIPGAWLVAAIFALHPLHAEPVSWISEQGVVLSGMLFLGSVYTYLMFVKSREQDAAQRLAGGEGVDPAQTWGLYAGAVVLALLAILSEPSALMVPVAIVLLLWWKKRAVSRDILLLLPLLFAGLVLWFINADIHKTAGEKTLIHDSPGMQLGVIGHAFWNLCFHLLIPLRFSALYLHGDSSTMLALFAGLPFAAVIVLYFFRQQIGAGPFVAIAISTLLTVFSVNWFDPSRLSNVTDGTAYLALIPLVTLIVAWVARSPLPGPQPQTVVGVSTAILIVLGALTLGRTYGFESSVALWRDVLRKDPRSAFAEASLAEQLRLAAIDDAALENTDQMKADLDEAVLHAQSALQIDPDNAPAQRTWANVLVSEGDLAQAVSHFESATKLSTTNAQLRDEYASALIELGRFQDAREPLDQALALDPTSSTTHQLLGQAFHGLGQNDRSIKELTVALEYDPTNLTARQKLAQVQTAIGRYKDAISNYTVMMQVDQAQMNRADLWQAIAEIKDKQGAYTPAVEYLQQAVELAPEDEGLKKELENEKKKQASTMPATRPAAGPTTVPASRP